MAAKVSGPKGWVRGEVQRRSCACTSSHVVSTLSLPAHRPCPTSTITATITLRACNASGHTPPVSTSLALLGKPVRSALPPLSPHPCPPPALLSPSPRPPLDLPFALARLCARLNTIALELRVHVAPVNPSQLRAQLGLQLAW